MAHPAQKVAGKKHRPFVMDPARHIKEKYPWCALSTVSQAVHNTRYMLKVCLQGQPLQHSPYSKSNWFTEFCKSLCLSQFTASFISVWAKASIAECIDKFLKEIDTAKKVQTQLWGNKRVLLPTLVTPQSCLWGHPYNVPTADQQCSSLEFNMQMILPQVHLRKPCYDFSFL